MEQALRRLRREGCVDDEGYAARFARSRLAHHGLGSHRIRAALAARGVARAARERGLAEALAEVPEAAALDALARRYWRDHARDEPPRRLGKLWGVLMRRGFPASLVAERLAALWPRHRELLEGLEPRETEEETVRTS